MLVVEHLALRNTNPAGELVRKDALPEARKECFESCLRSILKRPAESGQVQSVIQHFLLPDVSSPECRTVGFESRADACESEVVVQRLAAH